MKELTYMITVIHEDECDVEQQLVIPALVVKATSAEESMNIYFEQVPVELGISYLVETIEVTDSDEFRWDVTLEQKVKLDSV